MHVWGILPFLFFWRRISRLRSVTHTLDHFEHAALPFSSRVLLLLLSDKILDEFAAFLSAIVRFRPKNYCRFNVR